MSEEDLIHHELSGKIIAAAIRVHEALKPGLDEKLYENALFLELKASGHKVDQQANYPVFYRETKIGTLIPDLIVDDTIVVDSKVASAFTEAHQAQMLGYLTITGLELALLLNFKFAKLQAKRVVKQF